MNRRVIELYDEYTHGGLDRRGFIGRLAGLAGSAAAAALAWERTVDFLHRELA